MSPWLQIRPVLVLAVSTTTGFTAAMQALCATKPHAPQKVSAGDKDNGGKVKVPRGAILELTLNSNPTTGYEWTLVTHDAKRLEPLGKPEFIPPKERLVGAGGQQVFRFQAKTAGPTTLELHYLRPFEKDKPPAKTYRLTVEISRTPKGATKDQRRTTSDANL